MENKKVELCAEAKARLTVTAQSSVGGKVLHAIGITPSTQVLGNHWYKTEINVTKTR